MQNQIITNKRTGERWQILGVNRTSDGFLIANAVQVDEDGERLLDEDGFELIHSLFLGTAN